MSTRTHTQPGHTHTDERQVELPPPSAGYTHTDRRIRAHVPTRVLRHISKRGAECMRREGVGRGWCVVSMETPSPSLIIIWGKMARGLLPRVTPPPHSLHSFSAFPASVSLSLSHSLFLSVPLFPPSFSSRAISVLSSAFLAFLFASPLFHAALAVSFLSRSSRCIPHPVSPPPSHRAAAPTLPASGILCLHLAGVTV